MPGRYRVDFEYSLVEFNTSARHFVHGVRVQNRTDFFG